MDARPDREDRYTELAALIGTLGTVVLTPLIGAGLLTPPVLITGLGVAPVPAIAFSGRSRPARYRMLELAGIEDVHYAYAVRSGAPLPGPAESLLELLARGV